MEIGRRAFLGMVGVGVSSLAWGGSALELVNKSTLLVPQPVRAFLPFGEGWRIYAVNTPYPRYDAATWRLRIDGRTRSCSPSRRPGRPRTSTA